MNVIVELVLSVVISSRSNNTSSLYFVAYIFSLPKAFVATFGFFLFWSFANPYLFFSTMNDRIVVRNRPISSQFRLMADQNRQWKSAPKSAQNQIQKMALRLLLYDCIFSHFLRPFTSVIDIIYNNFSTKNDKWWCWIIGTFVVPNFLADSIAANQVGCQSMN